MGLLDFISFLISSCDQVCNVSQFAFSPRREVEDSAEEWDYYTEQDFERNSFYIFYGDKVEGISCRYSR